MSEAMAWVPEDTFGARLALVRARMGWNVRQAAIACGLNEVSWKRWERGEVLPHDLLGAARKVARATGCELEWLVMGGPLRCSSVRLVPEPPGQGHLFPPDPPKRGHLQVAR